MTKIIYFDVDKVYGWNHGPYIREDGESDWLVSYKGFDRWRSDNKTLEEMPLSTEHAMNLFPIVGKYF